MGHIELASPVAHVWFLKSIPSRMGVLLGVPMAELSKVVYFSGYIITKVNEDERQKVYKEIDTEYKSKLKTLTGDEAKDRLKTALSDAKSELDGLKRWRVLDELEYHKYSMKYGHVFEAEIGAEAVYNILINFLSPRLPSLKSLAQATSPDLRSALTYSSPSAARVYAQSGCSCEPSLLYHQPCDLWWHLMVAVMLLPILTIFTAVS
jgi:DNA-directed RNA polymerase beta' subunit